jgi:hypothetical protein
VILAGKEPAGTAVATPDLELTDPPATEAGDGVVAD